MLRSILHLPSPPPALRIYLKGVYLLTLVYCKEKVVIML